MAAPNYRTSTTALVDALKGLFENRTCTEAQAIANATSKPNTIYYTTDTKCVVVGGQIYGRGQQLSSVFRFIPATETPGHGDFTDTSVIYVQPDGTNFILWWYSPSNTWVQTGSIAFDIATSASDISYDLTQTPDLGSGDVQSAIEALDGKVEAVDARIDDEKVEFIKERFPSKNVSNYTRATVNYKVEIQNGIVTYISNSSYRTGYYSRPVPKGSLCQLSMYYTGTSSWGGLAFWGYSTESPAEYIAEHGSIIGLPTTRIRISYSAGVWIRDYLFLMPEDGYLICAYQNTYSPTLGTSLIYDANDLTDLYTEYYQKGVADGSGMASIVGLGYNIYDYITGAVNMEGFEYGVEYRAENPSIVHTSGGKFSDNTSLVYFPKLDVTGMKTNLDNTFFDCTNLVCVPKLTFNGSATTQNMFSGCTKLRAIGELNGLTITTNRYMFANTTSLQRIEGIDITSVVNSTNSTTANMFRSSSRTSGCTARYILFKGLGYSSMTKHYFANATYWGVNNAANPDALQSLIDTLYTYSADRSGGTACTIHLSTNSKNALNSATIDGESAIEKISAKGYTIA